MMKVGFGKSESYWTASKIPFSSLLWCENGRIIGKKVEKALKEIAA
jgi:hypothetical protein